MPAPQCGLPPLATMTLPPQQHPTAISPPVHHAPPPRLPPPSLTQSHQQKDSWPQLSSPPQQWQGAEEYMRDWLQASIEEDKRRQEEERTRQESLRLEQRKVEMDMLCTSLQGGIPPAMIPLVFVRVGSGGVRPQMAGSQQLTSVSQAYHLHLLPPPTCSSETPKGNTAAHPSSSPGDGITSTNTAGPIVPARVSTPFVDNLL